MVPSLLAFVSVSAILAQQPAFDVATVKAPDPVAFGTAITINLGTYRNGTLTMTNVTLSECLQFAYALVSQEQVAGPDWIRSRETRFDIVAKTAPDIGLDGARRMLRTLLGERLKVMTRTERRPFSFAALVQAKNGNKLTPAREGETGPASGAAGRIVGAQMQMAGLASLLSRFERQVVVDRTGLTGRYQVKLEWATADGATPEGPSLLEALEDQLGLRLESRREPLDVIVVERAERVPAEN